MGYSKDHFFENFPEAFAFKPTKNVNKTKSIYSKGLTEYRVLFMEVIDCSIEQNMQKTAQYLKFPNNSPSWKKQNRVVKEGH